MKENDPRFANLERKVGAFILLALLVVAAVVALVGVRQGLFTPKTEIAFFDDSGRDLSEGMAVVTRGFRIGKITRLQLTETGKVEATLAIERSHLRWIRQDSTARVVAKALIGDKEIDVSPGSPGAPQIAPGGVLPFQRDPDLAEIAKRVMEEVKPVLLSVRSLIQYLDDPNGDVKSAIANVNRLSAGLLETREQLDDTIARLGDRLLSVAGRLDALAASLQADVLPQVKDLVAQGTRTAADAGGVVRSLDALVKEDLRGLSSSLRNDLIPQVRALLDSAGRTAAGAERGVETVDRKLPELLEKLEATLENVRALTANLVPPSREVGGLLAEGGALIEDSQALVRRTRQLWPFRTGSTGPERTIDVDSYRSAPRRPDGAGAPRPRTP
jgi:ABC-type transporter Mla subunit MlaD